MRYLVLSDIHANAVAFEAVLRHAERQRFDKVLFLGDAVGYYSEPATVVARLRELEPIALIGNHDAMLLEQDEAGATRIPTGESFVTEIIHRHLQALEPKARAFLRSFVPRVIEDEWEAVHGALRSPWEYLNTLTAAQANLPYLQRNLCFFGHTHVPAVYACVQSEQGEMWRAVALRGEKALYRLPPNARVFFNPGSVGQPRDGVPLASYAIFDEEQRWLELHRVTFDTTKVRRKLREAGYPEPLGARLEAGR